MIIEMQLGADKFLSVFREGIKKAFVPKCEVLQLPLGDSMLDRVVITQTKLEANAQKDSRVIVVQTTHWNLIKKSALLATTNGEAPPLSATFAIDLVFAVTVDAQPDIALVVTLDEARTDDPAAKLIAALLTQNPPESDSTTIDILGALESLTGGVPTVHAIGIAADTGLSRVAVRFDIGKKSLDAGSWTSFFAGAIPDRLQGNGWSLLVDKAFIVDTTVSRFNEVLANIDDFSLDSGPYGTWAGAGSPRVDVGFSGEVVDACQCFWGKIDLDVNLDASVDFLVPKANTLQTKIVLDYDKDFVESACCVLTAATLWSLLGTELDAKGKILWVFMLGVIPLAGSVIFAIGLITKKPDLGSPPTGCVADGDLSFVCTETPDFNSLPVGAMQLLQATGVSEGLVLAGSLEIAEAKQPLTQVIGIHDFSWQFQSCSTGTAYWETTLALSSKEGTPLPLVVCGTEVLDDPQGYFTVQVKPAPKSAYLVKIYSLTLAPGQGVPHAAKVILRTNGGTRFVTIPAAAGLSEAEVTAKTVFKNALCEAINTKWIDFEYELKHPWPEPDPVEEPLTKRVRMIDALVSGLRSGERVSIRRGTQTLTRASADARGVAHVRTTVPYSTQEKLSVQRDSATASRPARGRRFDLTQTLIEFKAEVGIPAPARDLIMGHWHGRPAAFVLTDRSLHVYDITVAALTRSVRAFPLLSASGLAYYFGHYLVWGASGIWSLSATGIFAPVAGMTGPVRDAVVVGNTFLALTPTGVEAYQRDGQPPLLAATPTSTSSAPGASLALRLVYRLATRQARNLTATGNILVAGDDRRLLLFDLSSRSRAPRTVTHGLRGLARLSKVSDVAVKFAVRAEGSDGASAIIDVGPGKSTPKARIISRQASPEGTAKSARMGSIIVELDGNRRTLRVGHIVGVSSPKTLEPQDDRLTPAVNEPRKRARIGTRRT